MSITFSKENFDKICELNKKRFKKSIQELETNELFLKLYYEFIFNCPVAGVSSNSKYHLNRCQKTYFTRNIKIDVKIRDCKLLKDFSFVTTELESGEDFVWNSSPSTSKFDYIFRGIRNSFAHANIKK